MACRQIIAAKFCVTLITCLLVCGIVTIEIPELVSLTNSTANDFATRKINSSALPVKLTTAALRGAASHFKKPAPITFRLNPATIEIAQLISSDLLALHSVLRT